MRSKSAKRMVGKWINVPKRQDFRFWHRRDLQAALANVCLSHMNGPIADINRLPLMIGLRHRPVARRSCLSLPSSVPAYPI